MIGKNSSRSAHRWGIVLGVLGALLMVPLSVLFPRTGAFWQVLSVVSALLAVRSLLGYSFPGARRAPSKGPRNAAPLR